MNLSICYPVFRDFDGLYFSAMDIPLSHGEVADDVEIVVVDNDPESPAGKTTKSWVEGHLAGCVPARYVAMSGRGGPAGTKQRCVEEAAGKFVLVMDSHVRVVRGGIARLLQFYADNPDTADLYSGPMFYDSDALRAGQEKPLAGFATHMDEVWRGENLGTWATNPQGREIDAAPFEVPAMGCGLFTCRKNAFVGFNKNFRGFGGEEYYIHHKTRQAGHKVFCLPFLRWVHRFGRPAGVPYPLRLWDKVRNYVIGHQELGLPLNGIHQHFVVDQKRMSEADWAYLVENAIDRIEPPKTSGCSSCNKHRIAANATLEQLYEKAAAMPSDIQEHCAKLRELASQSNVVVEFTQQHTVSTVALLAGQPAKLISYGGGDRPFLTELKRLAGKTAFQFADSSLDNIGEIPECDLLFEDFRHTADHIQTILAKCAAKVKRWIVLHDTQIYGEQGEDGGSGILPAVRNFLRDNPRWSVVYHTQANNGLTVLGCRTEDKPKLPSLPKMAWNYAKALAKHKATGANIASQETIQSRLDICTTCSQRTDNRCAVCGCYLDVGPNGQEGKTLWADSVCPLGNW